ncbi:putative F-box domain, leucine-rich repeat domain, L domain-containing protein [Medicago truncatula]|uniref:Putative F-box domain, leucine-rich repeat domain, L domain-containing protein n=1 Tax=Medicago truncatula TaxID=3880 RepID=A0A396HKC2_MEDTR|nr:putative F-box domain, leucine-rich repeat domain, L domain-containing protein [Medicago truncatula]
MNWESLTEDLQIEILTRLPEKSLMRFKCVQQSWEILFESPSFEKKWRLHNSKNGYDESFNFWRYSKRSKYPRRRSLAKSKASFFGEC